MKRAFVMLAACVLLAGCSAYSYPDKKLYGKVPPSKPAKDHPAVTAADDATFTANRLNGAPIAVQAAFEREYPEAVVTSVVSRPTGAGPNVYDISFIDDGRPGVITYAGNGAIFAP